MTRKIKLHRAVTHPKEDQLKPLMTASRYFFLRVLLQFIDALKSGTYMAK